MDREKAALGVLVTMQEPTRDMRTEAASAGFYDSPWGKHPRLQLLTVGELLAGKGIDYPRTAGVNVTLTPAPRVRELDAEQPHLFDHARSEARRKGRSSRRKKRR